MPNNRYISWVNEQCNNSWMCMSDLCLLQRSYTIVCTNKTFQKGIWIPLFEVQLFFPQDEIPVFLSLIYVIYKDFSTVFIHAD